MIDCNTCRRHLDELEKGELGEELAVKVRLHLDGCEFCRAWRRQTTGDRLPGTSGNGHGHKTRLDSFAMWYDRFEKDREPHLSRRRMRLIQMFIVLLAFTLMVVGIRMRGERMNRIISSGHETPVSIEPEAILTRELALTPESAQVFFPLLLVYQQQVDSLETLRREALARLDGLAGDTSPHNQLIPELNARIETLQNQRALYRSAFLSRIAARLGPGKESALRRIQDVWDSGVRPAR